MENRFFLGLGLAVLFAVVPHGVHAYDDQTTHPALTDQMVTLYNKLYPDDQISDAERVALRQGSIDEDIVPRSLNHLYDPVHHTGWTGRAMGWSPAILTRLVSLLALLPDAPLPNVTWIEADGAQEAYVRYGGNRSWPAAIRALVRGDHHTAYTLLGSSLHLLEDAGVPDHARDDTHAHQLSIITGDYGSPYESYTARYGVGVLHIAESMAVHPQDIPHYVTPHEYLADNAVYSAQSFFSKDTVADSRFALPVVERELDGVAYAIASDGQEVPVARRVTTWSLFSGATSSLRLGFSPEFDSLMEAQFQVLARRTLLLGVGMLRDFRVAQHRVNTAPIASRYVWSLAGELDQLPQIARLVADGSTAALSQAQRAYAWLHNQYPVQPVAVDVPSLNGDVVGEVLGVASSTMRSATTTQKSVVSSKKSTSSSPAPVASSTPMDQLTHSCSLTNPPHVVINEVAWMGTLTSASDEWIELYNPDDDAHDFEGWELVSSDGKLYADLDGSHITAHGYAILERTDDDVLPDITATALYTGGLSNTPPSGYVLRLLDPQCGVIDTVVVQGVWPAGDAFTRRTMERVGDGAWQTSALPQGTPGRINSAGYIAPQASTTPPVVSSNGGSVATTTSASSTTSVVVDAGVVLISEIASGGIDAGDEFVELYNPEARPVSLLGWSLQYLPATASSTPQKRDLPDISIPSHGYLLIARATTTDGVDGYVGAVVSDVAHRTFALSVNGASLALVRSVTRISATSSPDVVDWVTYPKLAAGSSFERAALVGATCVDPRDDTPGSLAGNGCSRQEWFIRPQAQPQNRSSSPEPSSEASTSVSTSSWVSFVIPAGLYQAESTTALWEAWALIRGAGIAPQELSTATQLIPQGVSIARLVYQACNGSVVSSPVLLLPLSPLACQPGGLLSGAFSGSYWEDGRLLVKIAGSFVPGEMLRWVRYAFSGGRAGEQYFTRVLMPTSTIGMSSGFSPAAPENFYVEHGGIFTRLGWSAAIDVDSIDATLRYELRISSSSDDAVEDIAWIDLGSDLSFEHEFAPGVYTLDLRARDEQGNVSPAASMDISVLPEPPPNQDVYSDQLELGSGTFTILSAVNLSGLGLWLVPQGGPYCCSSVVVTIENAAGVVLVSTQIGRRVVDGGGYTAAYFDHTVNLISGLYTLRVMQVPNLSNAVWLGGTRSMGDWNGTGMPYIRFLE